MENPKKLQEMQEDLRRRVVGAMKHGLPVHVAMATLGRRMGRSLHPTIENGDYPTVGDRNPLVQWGFSISIQQLEIEIRWFNGDSR